MTTIARVLLVLLGVKAIVIASAPAICLVLVALAAIQVADS